MNASPDRPSIEKVRLTLLLPFKKTLIAASVMVMFLLLGNLVTAGTQPTDQPAKTSPTSVAQEIHFVDIIAADPGACTFCSGSKKCQSCYPAGSKMNYSGAECYNCSAIGKCTTCRGSGKCHLCDGEGFSNGCNNCTKRRKGS